MLRKFGDSRILPPKGGSHSLIYQDHHRRPILAKRGEIAPPDHGHAHEGIEEEV